MSTNLSIHRLSEHAFHTRWLWVTVLVFVAGEWVILFYPDLLNSFSFLRQRPQAVACTDWPKPETAFLNLKAWVIVSLSQSIIWGAVTYASIRWLGDLWRTGEPSGRLWRVVCIVLRTLAFGFGLWFLLMPSPHWDLGCFSQHINPRGSAVLAYVAVGSASIVMWVLENRVEGLAIRAASIEVAFEHHELRQKLRSLLSMSSLVLVFGIIGLLTRRAFIESSTRSFFPQPIVLEGFEYTLLLGLAYAPVHAAFNSVGEEIRVGLMPFPATGGPGVLLEWSGLSKKLGELMQIRLYDWKSLGPGFPILAPFLLSLLSTLVKN